MRIALSLYQHHRQGPFDEGVTLAGVHPDGRRVAFADTPRQGQPAARIFGNFRQVDVLWETPTPADHDQVPLTKPAPRKI